MNSKKRLHIVCLILISLYLYACQSSEEPQPLSIELREDSAFAFPSSIECFTNNELIAELDIHYGTSNQLQSVDYRHSLLADESCIYEYQNDYIISKVWTGIVHEGIHGNNQLIDATFSFDYHVDGSYASIEREVHSTLNPKRSIQSLNNSTGYLVYSSSSLFVDTLTYWVNADQWQFLKTNNVSTYEFKDEETSIIYTNEENVFTIQKSTYSIDSWPLELQLIFYALLEENDTALLLTDISTYIDKFRNALRSTVPVVYKGKQIEFSVDTYGRLISLRIDNNKLLTIRYDK